MPAAASESADGQQQPNNDSRRTTPTAPYRANAPPPTNAQNVVRPKPSYSFSPATSNYLNSQASKRLNSSGVSTSLNSSLTSAFGAASSVNSSSYATSSSSSFHKARNSYLMEAYATTMPHTNSLAASTPRPSSQQSSASSPATSASPPMHLLTTAVESAAVAVVPANNHATEHQSQSATPGPNEGLAFPELELPTFDKPDDVTDIELEVEGRKLHVHRAMLVLVSPVFRAMLTGDFIERKQNSVTLKDKKYDDVLEFLQSIYPPWNPISRRNVRVLLKYADEYRVDGLLRRCEDFLLALKMARDAHEGRLWAYDGSHSFCRVSELLGLANSFNLERLSQALVDYLSPRPLAWQTDGPDFFAYCGPELENRILNKALTIALQLIDRNRYCDTVKELLNGHKVYFEGQY